MSSYNKTLLWSGSSTNTITFSEPVTNFSRFQLVCTGSTTGIIFEFPAISSASYLPFCFVGGNWTDEVYALKMVNISITNYAKTMSTVSFNIIGCITKTVKMWGSGVNATKNEKVFIRLYGIDRINYTEQDGAGSPGTGWRKYNEVLLWQGNPTNTIVLNENASNFERLKIGVGSTTGQIYYQEVDAPISGSEQGTRLTLSVFGSGANNNHRFGWCVWEWSNGTTLVSKGGKSYLSNGTGSMSTNYTSTGDISDNDLVNRPIVSIIGINRKS